MTDVVVAPAAGVWVEHLDDCSGYPYYLSLSTGETTWDRPIGDGMEVRTPEQHEQLLAAAEHRGQLQELQAMAAEDALMQHINERWSAQASARARARAQQRAAAVLPQVAAHVAQLSAADAAETMPPRWREERDKRTGTPCYVRISANGTPLDSKAAPLLVKPPDFLPQSKASAAMGVLETIAEGGSRFRRAMVKMGAAGALSRVACATQPAIRPVTEALDKGSTGAHESADAGGVTETGEGEDDGEDSTNTPDEGERMHRAPIKIQRRALSLLALLAEHEPNTIEMIEQGVSERMLTLIAQGKGIRATEVQREHARAAHKVVYNMDAMRRRLADLGISALQ